jgi:hypothetical protein
MNGALSLRLRKFRMPVRWPVRLFEAEDKIRSLSQASIDRWHRQSFPTLIWVASQLPPSAPIRRVSTYYALGLRAIPPTKRMSRARPIPQEVSALSPCRVKIIFIASSGLARGWEWRCRVFTSPGSANRTRERDGGDLRHRFQVHGLEPRPNHPSNTRVCS